MSAAAVSDSVRLAATGCITPLGDATATAAALVGGVRALQPTPVLGRAGGEAVPLALLPGRALDETNPPAWVPVLRALLAPVADRPWGTARFPVAIASSNFGVGSLYAFRRYGEDGSADHGTPHGSTDLVRRELGWGPALAVFSHACVSAHLALAHASRLVLAGAADEVLVLAYDFLSPFVAGGFHALKILNAQFPAPYQARATGSIGLGDGAAYAVVTRGRGDLAVAAQSLHNELHHFTANRADGSGFATVLAPLAPAVAGRKLWLKGHGTGTLEAGQLEAAALAQAFPGAPLVGWKGSLGHTLGSCGLVELAVAAAALRAGTTPGTVGSEAPTLAPNVALAPFANAGFDGVLCTSNAFGGAHAALLLSHV
ncbi:hypothetical protein [Opitutus sp. ER46]|uniref:hypothetical protein n=1 Tax=Opitutus sp. ER46 TaxID=2161864 RepID=UPI000D2FBEE9|nr:hypothetical protein [Opitutus sp. ER46]PTY00691.1 hypothetical protein DB354_01140 [Opitutus sp. ER46]